MFWLPSGGGPRQLFCRKVTLLHNVAIVNQNSKFIFDFFDGLPGHTEHQKKKDGEAGRQFGLTVLEKGSRVRNAAL